MFIDDVLQCKQNDDDPLLVNVVVVRAASHCGDFRPWPINFVVRR